MKESQKNIKAVGLMSGGLDSVLAAKIIKDLGIEVYAVSFAMPWQKGKSPRAENMSKKLGIHFNVFQLGDDYLEVLKNPQYGYGSAFNPCMDCHIFMIEKAAEYMKEIGAEFVFTGEVVGQRPNSQRKDCLIRIEKVISLEGRLLRPLSAKLLEPTVPESEGMVDRDKLFGLSGRSRKPQMQLAQQWGIEGYSTPAGGCLLTEKHFGRRMKDILHSGCRGLQDIVALQWGRYFRLNKDYIAILGRDKKENELLIQESHDDDYILEPEEFSGPTLLLKGPTPSPEVLQIAAGLVQRYSKERDLAPQKVNYWLSCDRDNANKVCAIKLDESKIKAMMV